MEPQEEEGSVTMRIREKRGLKPFAIALVVMALVAASCGDSDDTTTTAAPGTTAAATTAAPAATGLEAVCAAGAEEGSFTYWATIEVDNFARIIEPFEARYPDIDIEFLSIREEDGAAQILTEVSAGVQPTPDMVYGSQDGLSPIITRGLIDTEFDWSQAGIDDELMLQPENMVRIFLVAFGLAYNTNLGTPEDLPQTWEELVDSKWAGNVVTDPRGNPFHLLLIEWSEEEVLDYATRFAAESEPILIRGGTAGMTEVLSGGALMTTSGRADSRSELQADGAPIEMHYLDIVPIRVLYNGLIKDAANPNAAACFAGWLATDEGQTSFESVEYKSNEFPPAGVPEDAILSRVTSPEQAQAINDIQQRIQEIIAPDFEG